jgi:hypothetical protein
MRLRNALAVGGLLSLALLVGYLACGPRYETHRFVVPSEAGRAEFTVVTHNVWANGKFVSQGHRRVKSLEVRCDGYRVVVSGSHIGVEDPNFVEQSDLQPVSLYSVGPYKLIRMIGADGGFSNVSTIVLLDDEVIHSQSLGLEDYIVMLHEYVEDAYPWNNEREALGKWIESLSTSSS